MLIQRKTLIPAVLTTLLFGGCAPIDQKSHDIAPVTTIDRVADTPSEQLAALNDSSKVDVNWLLHYFRLISTVPGNVLADEYERSKNEFSTNRTAKTQWQLAMLLSIPNASFYDAGRSSELFKDLTNNEIEHDPQLNDAAFLMYTLVNERHKISKKSAALEDELAESQSSNKTLQDQLNALKAIENTLYQRNKSEVTPKP
jgi:hypothetical protein